MRAGLSPRPRGTPAKKGRKLLLLLLLLIFAAPVQQCLSVGQVSAYERVNGVSLAGAVDMVSIIMMVGWKAGLALSLIGARSPLRRRRHEAKNCAIDCARRPRLCRVVC